MRKLISSFLIVTLAVCSLSFCTATNVKAEKNEWPSGPSLYGKSAVMIEASTGTVLYSKKMNKKMYPASITKIMTALLTIENCKMDETVVYSDAAVNSLSYDDANIACQVGEKMSVKECLYALMLSSANEVATALGEHIAGSTKEFAKMMNERASKAGAKNTHFENANGLHDVNHYVTAYDMAMIMKDALQYPSFCEIINTTEYTIQKNNKRKDSFASYQRHKMVWPTSGYYYEGIIGGKTGYTDQAGTTLVTAAKRNGMTLITVVLHSNGTNVYKDTAALLDFGFDNFNLKNISANDTRFKDESMSFQSPFTDTKDSIHLDEESTVVLPKKATFSSLKTSVEFNQTADSFATITYNYYDRTVGSAKLVYSSSSDSDNQEIETTAKAVKEKNKDKKITKKESVSTANKSPKVRIKIPKALIRVFVVVLILSVIIIFMILQKRRLDRIRQMKRHRNRS